MSDVFIFGQFGRFCEERSRLNPFTNFSKALACVVMLILFMVLIYTARASTAQEANAHKSFWIEAGFAD